MPYKDPEKNRAAARAWQAANREKVRAYVRAWREANREKVRAYVRAWREANQEKVRSVEKRAARVEYKRRYRKRPEVRAKRNEEKRRARMRLSTEEREKLLEYFRAKWRQRVENIRAWNDTLSCVGLLQAGALIEQQNQKQ